MNTTQLIIILGTVVAFIGLGFMMSASIKKHEAKMTKQKKKKGRNRYLQESKRPGGK